MTHVRVWKFRPPNGREHYFAAAYGKGGAWDKLFARAAEFRGTTLLMPAEPGGWWLTIDRWADAGAFAAFQQRYGEDYRALDAELEGMAGEEEFVGAFEDAG